jgi:spore coat polysaccharide biosynthesis predicted glycosyltransferase SpsG
LTNNIEQNNTPLGSIPIIIRVEVSREVGFGHMIRCLNLVEGLPCSIKPYLIAKSDSNLVQFTELLSEKGWEIIGIPSNITMIEDAYITAKYVNKFKARALITDLVHHENIAKPDNLVNYHRELKRLCVPFIMSIEDCRMTGYSSHVAIVPIPCKNVKLELKKLDDCHIMTGYNNFIFNPKFFPIQKRLIRKKANRVLVCIGGTDPKGTTMKVVESLDRLKKNKIIAKIILGSGSKNAQYLKLSKICNANPNIELLGFSDSIKELFQWADIAIVGEGLIKYEAALTGTPSLLITQIDHESDPVQGFIEIGCSKYIGKGNEIKVNEFSKEISSLLNDYNMRTKFSKAGQTTFIENGILNIYDKMLCSKGFNNDYFSSM